MKMNLFSQSFTILTHLEKQNVRDTEYTSPNSLSNNYDIDTFRKNISWRMKDRHLLLAHMCTFRKNNNIEVNEYKFQDSLEVLLNSYIYTSRNIHIRVNEESNVIISQCITILTHLLTREKNKRYLLLSQIIILYTHLEKSNLSRWMNEVYLILRNYDYIYTLRAKHMRVNEWALPNSVSEWVCQFRNIHIRVKEERYVILSQTKKIFTHLENPPYQG